MKTSVFSRLGILALLLLFSVSLFRCGNKGQSLVQLPAKLVVDEPFENLKIASTSYKVNAEKGGIVATETGTQITIPANAFIDKNGNPVIGEVELNYREFHTPADIIASGIPMEYTHEGKVMNFESAGMFEIKGLKAGSELDIAPGKNLDIQMASYKPGNDYNFYCFDKEKGQWTELDKNLAAAENATKKEQLAKLDAQPTPAKPIEPQKADDNATVINLDVNYTLYPHMKEFNGLMWQYAGTNPKNDPENNADIFTAKWKYIDLVPADEAGTGSAFNLTIKTSDKTYTALMKPVLKGKNFEKVKQKFIQQRQEYLEMVEAKAKETERLKREGDFTRALTVSQFGIYNCDRFYANTELYSLNWDYIVEGPVDKNSQKIYHVCKTDNSVVYYYPNTKEIKFDPNKENCLVAVLPDDRVAIFDAKDFEQLKTKGLKKGDSHTFKFKTLQKTFSSVSDLNQLLGNI